MCVFLKIMSEYPISAEIRPEFTTQVKVLGTTILSSFALRCTNDQTWQKVKNCVYIR